MSMKLSKTTQWIGVRLDVLPVLLLLLSTCSCSSYLHGLHVVTTLKITEDP
jgi:hypothetical protein